MQVPWKTIKLISQTKAIDLWILFPLGVAVNRLLKKDGKINEVNKNKLNSLFGVSDWFDIFYSKNKSNELFCTVETTEKNANFQFISKYFVKRLKTIFSGVAEKPLPLFNSKNNPLYLLCFASGNPKGSKTAIKIANYILNKGNPYA
jgi:three-Cys-motif partner protein